MDRRRFFGSLGAIATAPLVAAPVLASLASCVGRDGALAAGAADQGLEPFRVFPLPAIDPALPFRPLRRKPRP